MDLKIRAAAQAHVSHAKKCKKPLDDCFLCKMSRDFFQNLPLNVLNEVLSEVPPRKFTVKLPDRLSDQIIAGHAVAQRHALGFARKVLGLNLTIPVQA